MIVSTDQILSLYIAFIRLKSWFFQRDSFVENKKKQIENEFYYFQTKASEQLIKSALRIEKINEKKIWSYRAYRIIYEYINVL